MESSLPTSGGTSKPVKMRGMAAGSVRVPAAHAPRQLLGLGQNARHDDVDAGGGRVQPIGLDQLSILQQTIEEERIEDEGPAPRQPRQHSGERLPGGGAQVGG